MKLKKNDLLNIADLVAEREIIDHGTIRRLFSDEACICIAEAEGCDEVGIGTIGDNDLADKLRELAANADTISEESYSESRICQNYLGDDIADYLEHDEENKLKGLEDLIASAEKLVSLS